LASSITGAPVATLPDDVVSVIIIFLSLKALALAGPDEMLNV